MKNDDEAGKPLEGNGSSIKRKSNSGCGGCLFPIILIALTVYCSFDKSDFYLMPGEANLWTDAMETVFDNLEEITPDSLEVYDDLNVLERSDYYINKGNVVYGLKPFVRVRSKASEERLYLMRVLGVVTHTSPDEFEIRHLKMDTLIKVPPSFRVAN